jgi:predicted deacylase
MSMLQVDSISAAPGERRCGYCYVPVGSVHVRLPILLVNGSRPGPRLALTAGLHPGEFVGVEALRDVARTCDGASLAGQLVACLLAYPPAFYTYRSGLSSLDGIDPNRVYPGNATGRPTERVVAWLFENVIRHSDVFMDLHGGGVTLDLSSFAAYRTSGDPELDRRARELAELFGLPVVRGNAPTGGNSHAAATRAGIPSLLIEVGALGSRSRDEAELVRDGLLRVMKRLGMIAEAPARSVGSLQRWRWTVEVEAPTEGLWYPEFQVGAEVGEGQVLGRILDLFDEVLAVVVAPQAGRVFYGERSLSVTCGSTLAAMAAPDTA